MTVQNVPDLCRTGQPAQDTKNRMKNYRKITFETEKVLIFRASV